MLEQELQKLGLSDKEARVYLASLQLGKSPVQEIAEQAHINRGTAYNIIESLMKKGLMSSFDQGKKTFFTAESPDRLISLIRIQEEELHTKKDEFSKFLPELRSMYGVVGNKPKVKYYEGVEGIKAIHEEYLKVKSKKIDNITRLDAVLQITPDLFESYSPRRVQKKIKSRSLYVTKNGPIDEIKNSDKARLRETKHAYYKDFPFEADISIFDNKVSFESYGKNIIGVIIEDDSIANSMQAIFNYLWKKN